MNINSKYCLMFLIIFMIMNNLFTTKIITTRKCSSELHLDTCYLRSMNTSSNSNDELVTIYYDKCKSNQECVSIDDGAYKCVSKKEFIKTNDDCIVNEECQSNICINNKCSHLQSGDICNSDTECDNDSYCKYSPETNEKYCTEYSFINEECNGSEKTGQKCKPYLACGSGKVCVDKFSLDDGTETESNFACKSGVAFKMSDGKNRCVNVTVTDECSTRQKCIINYKYGELKEEEEIDCVYKSDGTNMICNYNEGSPEMLTYIELYKEKIGKLDSEEINEIEDYDTLDNYNVKKAFILYNHRVELLDAEQCVIDAYVSKGVRIGLMKVLFVGLIALLM